VRRLISPQARIRTLVGVSLLAAALAVLLHQVNALDTLEQDSIDGRFQVRGDRDPPKDVVLVLVNDVTLDELDTRWPFPRSMHAKVVDRLRRAGAKVIAYDVQFTEPTTPKEDGALIDAVARAHGHTVLATTEVDEKGHSNIFGGEGVLHDIGARSANTTFEPDAGGVLRMAPYKLDRLKGFGVVAAELARGKKIRRGDVPDDPYWVDYAGGPGTYDAVSFSRVLRGQVASKRLRGKVVIVGASAPRLHDLHQTPFSDGEPMPGPEVLANAVSTALDDFPLRRSPQPIDVIVIVLLALTPAVASIRYRPVTGFALALGAGVVYLLAAQLAFQLGVIVPLIVPLGALVLAATAVLGVHYGLAAFERAQVRSTFARFVPADVVTEVLARTDGDLRLGGVRRTTTVMFSDLRSFTSFAERLEADQVIEVLNRYLSEMSDAIMDEGGTLVAYMGDGIMAVFGAPLEQPDHADRALRAAREMVGPRLAAFNEWLREHGLSEDGFRMGVGLNTGPVMSGNVGSERRMEYTAVGDTTNTAARLEGMTKGTPFAILLADSTFEAMKDRPHDLEHAGEVEVRGRERAVKVWGLEGS
jgi:adenylate cyclase